LVGKNGFGKIKKIFEELFKTLLFLVLAPPPHPFRTFPNSHFFLFLNIRKQSKQTHRETLRKAGNKPFFILNAFIGQLIPYLFYIDFTVVFICF